jgi:hypothetical protein
MTYPNQADPTAYGHPSEYDDTWHTTHALEDA